MTERFNCTKCEKNISAEEARAHVCASLPASPREETIELKPWEKIREEAAKVESDSRPDWQKQPDQQFIAGYTSAAMRREVVIHQLRKELEEAKREIQAMIEREAGASL